MLFRMRKLYGSVMGSNIFHVDAVWSDALLIAFAVTFTATTIVFLYAELSSDQERSSVKIAQAALAPLALLAFILLASIMLFTSILRGFMI